MCFCSAFLGLMLLADGVSVTLDDSPLSLPDSGGVITTNEPSEPNRLPWYALSGLGLGLLVLWAYKSGKRDEE